MPRGAEALDRSVYAPEPQLTAPEFKVLEGEGRDLAERRAIDPAWRRAFKLFVLGAAIVASLGILRVQMTVWCVEALSANAELRAEADRADGLLEALDALNARRVERGLEPFWAQEEVVERDEDGLRVVEVPRQ